VPHNLQYAPVHHHSVGVVDQQQYAAQTAAFPTPPLQHAPNPNSPEETFQSEYAQQDLADLLGSLKVDEAGTAPYLNSKMRSSRDEEPALEDGDDYKTLLPPLTVGPGSKIRIPPELMPDDDTVLHYLDLYFVNAHPFVPVLDKNYFYHQWHNNRESISPLLLEAMFAIAGRLADEPAQGQQWLALATRMRILHYRRPHGSPKLTSVHRTCRLLHGRASVEHAPGADDPLKGQGISTEKGVLLPVVDEYRAMRPAG
jgi:hypothetical protein